MSASSPLQIEAQENLSPFISSRPQAFKLTNLTNSQPCDITALQVRIHDLQGKVRQLQQRLRTKRKRNRRKSSEVDKRHKCEECKKQYGSIVSLNLHQRIKHRRTKIEQQEA